MTDIVGIRSGVNNVINLDKKKSDGVTHSLEKHGRIILVLLKMKLKFLEKIFKPYGDCFAHKLSVAIYRHLEGDPDMPVEDAC